jgi:tetratricopeptide (TPR) repeat protein
MRVTSSFIRYLLLIWGLLLVGLHLLAAFTGTVFLWGVDSWAYFPKCLGVILSLAGLVVLIPPVTRRLVSLLKSTFAWAGPAFNALGGHPAAVVLAAAAGGLFWRFSCKVHLLGDGYWWIRNLERGINIHINEPLALYLTWLTRELTGKFMEISAEHSFQVVSVLSGAASVYLLFLLARLLGKKNGGASLIFLGMLSLGSVQLFFGYVETYPPVIAAVLLYLYLAVRQLDTGGTVFWPSTAFLLCVLMHLTTAALTPSLVYLYLRWWRQPCRSNKLGNVALVTAGPVTAVVLFLLLIGLRPGDFSDPATVSVMPFFPFVLNSPEYFNYNFFSFPHVRELFNLVLLVSPFCIPLCLLTVLQGVSPGDLGRFLILASVFPLCALILFNPELGFPRDWDVFAYVLLAPTLLGLYSLVEAGDRDKKLLHYSTAVIVVIGLLHVAPWVLVQADKDRALARYENLLDNNLLHSRHARTYGYEEIAVYFRKNGIFPSAEEYYRKAIETDPESYRLYAGQADVFYRSGQKDKALASILKSVDLAPESLRARFNLALFYHREGYFKEAEEQYKIIIQMYPNHLPAVFNLAACFYRQGLVDEAVSLYRYILKRKPDHQDARENLEKILQAHHLPEPAGDSIQGIKPAEQN